MLCITLLLAGASAHASDVSVTPAELSPGDLFILKVKSQDNTPVDASIFDRKIYLYPDGDYLMGLVPVDIDVKPDMYKLHIRRGTETLAAHITVRIRDVRTINLTLPEGKVTLSPEDQKRVEEEHVLQTALWSKTTEPAWEGRFISPLNTEVSTEFGVKRIMNKKKTSIHRGTDFRGKAGTPVQAVNSGTVVLSRDLFYGGNTLVIDHGMGLYSVYMHLSKFNAAEGERVEKGRVVGFVGSSGRATGPHLHMSVKLNGVSVDPEALFRLAL